MSVAFEVEYEACRPRLYVVPDLPARSAPSPQVRRRRVVLVAVVAVSCSCFWHCRYGPWAGARWRRRRPHSEPTTSSNQVTR